MRKPILIVLASLCLWTATSASAQDRHLFTASLATGIGGALGEDDVGLDNTTFQLGLAMDTSSDIQLALRFGQMSFDANDRVGNFNDFDLTYITLGGEYRFFEDYYTSGVYLALGSYELDASNFFGGFGVSDTTIGVALGLTGEFEINPRWAVRVEISGHILGSAEIDTIGMALVGAAYSF